MSIKAYDKRLYIGKDKITIDEALEDINRFKYEEIGKIEYQFAANGQTGFMRFKLLTGNSSIFPFKIKNNVAISKAVEYIKEKQPNLELVEVQEKLGINERYAQQSIKKKAIPFVVVSVLLIASTFYFLFAYSYYNKATYTITLDKYNQLQAGMSYNECVNIIGSEGEPMVETNIAERNSKAYMWYADDFGSNAIIYFMNDSLYSKAQHGLN